MNKANNLLGLIKRSVGTTNVNVFSTLYLSLVRPILEYALPVWCPLVKDIRALESIQRKASRLALNQHKGEVPYADRCKLSKWPSLSDRRNYLSLTECYKFVDRLNFHDFFEFSKVGSTSFYKSESPLQIVCLKRKTRLLQMFFFY